MKDTKYYKKKMKEIASESDHQLGLMKRLSVIGFIGKPLWFRRFCWFMLGILSFAIFQSYFG